MGRTNTPSHIEKSEKTSLQRTHNILLEWTLQTNSNVILRITNAISPGIQGDIFVAGAQWHSS